MKSTLTTLSLTFALLLVASNAHAGETNCTDGVDNDGDTVVDCGDNDCKLDAACQPDGNSENTNKRCSDWVDNDSDGHVDCDDRDCEASHITACHGSWDAEKAKAAGSATKNNLGVGGVPELPTGGTVEDLIGKGGDIDGERNDVLCADGLDNDGDGAIDCADFGCRFDASVSVCRDNPGSASRLSVTLRLALTSKTKTKTALRTTSTPASRPFSCAPLGRYHSSKIRSSWCPCAPSARRV